MGRYRGKVERELDGTWKVTLYEDPPHGTSRVLDVAMGATREEAIDRAKDKRDRYEEQLEPEWLDFSTESR